jgi:hypothetical protein
MFMEMAGSAQIVTIQEEQKCHNLEDLSMNISYFIFHTSLSGSGSSVGIATDYGLDGPGIESRWGRNFPPIQTGPVAHQASCAMGTGSFPGVKCGWGAEIEYLLQVFQTLQQSEKA